jgi:hypothetical protein
MPVDDHPPLLHFRGRIPEGSTAPAVIVGRRRYRNVTEHHGEPVGTEEALASGHLAFEPFGTKLRGRWALTRVATGKEERWILVKGRDEYADEHTDVTVEQPQSVLSGRTVEEVGGTGG